MADLQAEAAAKNLLAELHGQTADATFKVELICIVDSSDKGIMIARTESRNIMLPGTFLFHLMKRKETRVDHQLTIHASVLNWVQPPYLIHSFRITERDQPCIA